MNDGIPYLSHSKHDLPRLRHLLSMMCPHLCADHRGREEEAPEKSSESPDSENNQLRCSSTSRTRNDPAYDPLNVNPAAIHLYETYFRSRALHGVDSDDPAEPDAREAEREPEDMYQNINIASMHNNLVWYTST